MCQLQRTDVLLFNINVFLVFLLVLLLINSSSGFNRFQHPSSQSAEDYVKIKVESPGFPSSAASRELRFPLLLRTVNIIKQQTLTSRFL